MRLDLSKIDAYELLDRLGVDKITDLGDEFKFCCPFHGETNPSACMNKSTTAYWCFSCHARGNAITFVSQLEHVSPMKAVQWLREWIGDDFAEPQGGSMERELESLWTDREIIKSVDRTMPAITPASAGVVTVDWDEFARAISVTPGSPADYMLNARGFSSRVLDNFGVGVIANGRVAIPVRDWNGRLVGYKARAIAPTQQPKYLVLEPRYEASRIVFGLDRVIAANASTSDNELILCEGELNVIAMHDKGFTNAVGISGSSLSDDQAKLLAWFASEVTLIFDCDDAGTRGILGWTDDKGTYHPGAIAKLQPHCRVFVTGEHDRDPADMTREEIQQLLDRRESSVNLMIK